jgi:CTP:molybdopterin cytidylyltransferase MocA
MGRLKQLLPFEGGTIIEHVVAEFLSSCVDEVIVVLGYRAEEIGRLLTPYAVRGVVNPNYREGGMLSSLLRGIEETPPQTEAICLGLGDQPFVTHQIIDTLIETYRNGGKGIVLPTCRGRRGHPILINLLLYRNEIAMLPSEIGLKALTLKHPDDLLEVEIGDEAILLDLDTPEEYESAVKNLSENQKKRGL